MQPQTYVTPQGTRRSTLDCLVSIQVIMLFAVFAWTIFLRAPVSIHVMKSDNDGDQDDVQCATLLGHCHV